MGRSSAKPFSPIGETRIIQDDMAFVDFALAQGLADPDKLGVGGWSYGGISTDFIIGQTNRSKRLSLAQAGRISPACGT